MSTCAACGVSVENPDEGKMSVCLLCWSNGWFIAFVDSKEILYTARYVEKERPPTAAELAEWRAATAKYREEKKEVK